MVASSNMKLLVAAAACGVAAAGSSSSSGRQQGRLSMNTVAARQKMLEEAWGKDLDSKGSPVQRVVGLLEKMKAQLEKEAASESEMYDKMVCWCETNEKEKTKAISDAEVKTDDLNAEIQERAAKFGELDAQIVSLKKQIQTDKDALATATAIREKEAAAFSEEEKSSMQALTNLKNAIDVLSKHNAGSASLVQLDSAEMASVKAVLRDVSFKYEMMMGDRPLSSGASQSSGSGSAAFLSVTKGKDLVTALRGAIGSGSSVMPADIAAHALARAAEKAKKSAGAFVQAPGYKSYNAQSGPIFGILNQMKDEFEESLTAEQKEEMKSVSDFKEMAAAKTVQIDAGEKKLDELEGGNADNQKALSDAKEDLELTRSQRTADVEFLQNLRLTCKDLDSQWQERSHTRSAEITAVAEALVILTEDDNREHLAKTVTLMQVSSVENTDAVMRQRRIRAAAALRKAAVAGGRRAPGDDDDLLAAWQGMRAVGTTAGGPRAQLSTLAVNVELDGFTEVKKAMDKMIQDLKDQQKEEVDHKAYCAKSFDENEKTTYTKGQEKSDLEAKIESLGASIQSLTDEIASAKTEIAETETSIKQASESREKENAEFQAVVADQRATQGILAKALAKLKDFYEKNLGAEQLAGSSLLQEQQTPPVQFNDYKKNAGSSPVIGLIEQIVEDSKSLEGDAISGETEAQAAYEDFIKSSNKVVADAQESITMKTQAISQSKMESETATSDHTSVVGELESLATYKADLHGECDFLLKNFDIRQRARQQEMDSIQEAKSILSGMQ